MYWIMLLMLHRNKLAEDLKGALEACEKQKQEMESLRTDLATERSAGELLRADRERSGSELSQQLVDLRGKHERKLKEAREKEAAVKLLQVQI